MELHKGQRVLVTLEAEVVNPVPDFDDGDVQVSLLSDPYFVPVESVSPVPNEYGIGQVWGDYDGNRFLVYDVREGYGFATTQHNIIARLNPTDTNLKLLLDTE